jgi:hypothetical protein
MKKLLLLILFLLPFTANSETVTTDNLLSNSTFGTGTTYDTTGWTISSGTSGHGNTTIGGGNAPGGSVAATGNTNIEQTVSSIKTAAGMTVNEVRKGWSSTMSTDIWYWNSQNNTTTLKQTITDNDGNVTTQQRVITDTGCGGINCGQYSNYTDTHIQGSNTKDDFSIKVGVANSNSLSGHYGPDIDDIQLKITYTDVPPIEEDTQEELDEITEDIDDVVEDIEDNIVWEDNFTFEEEYAWEEDFYFEEDFNTDWETFDTTWEEYEIEFDDDMYFEMEEEFVEFETVMMPEDTFEDMYMEEFEEFEEFEDAWEMEPEMTEMDTFFNEMTEDDWQEFEEMSEDEFTEFIEEEFPEEFAEMQEEMEETPVEEEMVFEEEEVAMTEEPEEAMEEPEEMTEDEPTETEVASEESTEEATDDVETESEPEESTQEVAEDESKPDAKADEPSGKVSTAKLKEEKIKTKSVKIDVAKIKEIIVEEVKVDLFSNQEALQEYSQVTFYQPEQIYTDVDNSFFDQVNMLEYSKEIYQNVRLASYMDNDPVEVHRKNMERINMEKQRLLIELQQLKGQQ